MELYNYFKMIQMWDLKFELQILVLLLILNMRGGIDP